MTIPWYGKEVFFVDTRERIVRGVWKSPEQREKEAD